MTALLRRLEELRRLEPGWFDGSGEAIDPTCIDAVAAWLAEVSPTPSIYPTPDGGVSCEWHGRLAVSLNVSPSGITCHAINHVTGASEEVVCQWGEPDPQPVRRAIDLVTRRALL